MPTTRRAVTLASEPADPSPAAALPRGCSSFKLRQADRLVSRHYDAIVAAGAGLKTSQYSLLSHIESLAPVRPVELARAMGMEASTLTRNLQPLIAQGWVEMGPGPDARSRLLDLTASGRAKRLEARKAWKQAQLSFNAKLGDARVAQLHALLDECLHLLAADSGNDDGPPAA